MCHNCRYPDREGMHRKMSVQTATQLVVSAIVGVALFLVVGWLSWFLGSIVMAVL